MNRKIINKKYYQQHKTEIFKQRMSVKRKNAEENDGFKEFLDMLKYLGPQILKGGNVDIEGFRSELLRDESVSLHIAEERIKIQSHLNTLKSKVVDEFKPNANLLRSFSDVDDGGHYNISDTALIKQINDANLFIAVAKYEQQRRILKERLVLYDILDSAGRIRRSSSIQPRISSILSAAAVNTIQPFQSFQAPPPTQLLVVPTPTEPRPSEAQDETETQVDEQSKSWFSFESFFGK
jgi:hypothetical protein